MHALDVVIRMHILDVLLLLLLLLATMVIVLHRRFGNYNVVTTVLSDICYVFFCTFPQGGGGRGGWPDPLQRAEQADAS